MTENNIHKVKSGRRERISFRKMEEKVDLPYLLEMQKESYDKFIKEGIGKVVKEWSVMEDYSKKATLYLSDPYFDEKPLYTEKECQIRKQTYEIALMAKAKLVVTETGKTSEQDVFLANIPLMNDSGNFVVNGVKRVVIGKLSRAPGIYCNKVDDKTGKALFGCTVRPKRGAWIEIEGHPSGVLKVIVDRQAKMSLGILLKSLGMGSDAEIIDTFGGHELIKNTLEKEPQKEIDEVLLELAKKLRPGDVPSIEAASKYINELFYTNARYDIGEVGRFKYDKKLSIATRIEGLTIAKDVVSPDGEILAKAGEVIDITKAGEIENAGVNEVWVKLEGGKEHKIVGNNRVDIYKYTGFKPEELGINPKLKVFYPELVRILKENKTKEKRIAVIKENIASLVNLSLTLDDLIGIVSYILDLNDGIGYLDEDDHLGNKIVEPVGETLGKAFRNGMIALDKFVKEKMQAQDFSNDVTPSGLVSTRPIQNLVKEFITRSTLSVNMDEVNPLSALGNKRRLTATGDGGVSRERAGTDVRDINYTHYGRICPVETPDGENIGLVLNLANYARLDEFGFIVTPYRVVDKEKGVVTDKIVYLTADEEDGYCVGQANEPVDANGKFINSRIPVRKRAGIIEVSPNQVDYIDASPKQFISTVTSILPFLENMDSARAQLACNMQRQALPLIKTEAPFVATGMEASIAKDSGALILAKADGKVTYADANTIKILNKDGKIDLYKLVKFEKSNGETCINQKPVVSRGDEVKKGEVIADGFATDGGELSLGRNVLVGFVNWEGYNYEDSILISERLVKEDIYTSICIKEHSIDACTTKLGDEEITRDIPNRSEDSLKNLDENGIIRIGSEVDSGDILVGKVVPKGETELTPEERLLRAIFGEKSREVKDKSLTVAHGEGGTVVDVRVLSRKNKDQLDNGVNMKVKVYIAQKRKIKVGDKMSGRHGNKGVVGRILPEADMPFLANGRPLDICLNPLGVPSRMNIGQLLELNLGLICKSLGIHVETPVFNGATEKDIQDLLIANNLPEDGKIQLYDGRTGEPFENRTAVGYMYMLKLNHMVDSKWHARSTGSYVLVTQQPIGGKAKFGGQRFGEMEVWALEAYGAANTLQEMLTIKSDDAVGRNKVITSIVQGTPIGEPGVPESFKVLIKELQSLGLDVKVLTDSDKEVNINELNALDSEENTAVKTDETLKDVELYDNDADESAMTDILNSDLNENDLFDSSALFDTFDDDDNE